MVLISALCAPWASSCHHVSIHFKKSQECTPCTLCTLCIQCTLCTSVPLILDRASKCTLHIYVHFYAPCAPVHPAHFTAIVDGTTRCHTLSKMHQSAHSAIVCTLYTLCTLCTLCTSEPLFFYGASRCTLYIMCTSVHPVHPVHPVHLIAIYFRKCTRVHSAQICALCAACALYALFSIFSQV
jgi:hypothetical protein